MEYQKIINLFDKTLDQPSKLRTINWVEMNEESKETYNTYDQIKFKTAMLKSSSCDYSDAYILVKENITVHNTAAAEAHVKNTNKTVISKNCAQFTACISEINNKQVHNAKYIDVVLPMYNLIEYSDSYSKTSRGLWQYFKDIAAVNNNGDVVGFNGTNATDSFDFKAKMTGQNNDDGEINNIEIMVRLKYFLSNFWRTLEMALINCEVNLILTGSANCVIVLLMLQIKLLHFK